MATTGQAIIAVDKATTWGTAVDVNGAGKGIYLTSTGNLVAVPEQLIDDSIGRVFAECVDQGKRNAELALGAYGRFDGPLWEMIALCIGDDNVIDLGSGEYNHQMTVQTTNSGLFQTLAVYDGSVVREIPSFKMSGFTIKGSAANIVEITLRGIGNIVRDTGQVNTTLASVTITTPCGRIPFNVQLYFDNENGAAFDSGDLVQASEFEFSFDRNLTPDFTTNNTLYQTAEPYEIGQPKTEIKLLFPKTPVTNYTAALQDLQNGTRKRLQAIFYGPLISVSFYSLIIQCPSMIVSNVESPLEKDNQQIPQSITLMGLKTTTAPNDMPGLTNPFRLSLTNTNATAYDV